MRIRSLVILLLLLALTVSMTACGGALPSLLPSRPASEAPAQTTAPAPASTEAPSPAVPAVQGADSVKTLMEKSLEYFRSGCDYGKIADVHDRQAYLAWFLQVDLYRDAELTWEQAMDKAALLFGSADALREKDPELASLVMEEFDVIEPEEALSEYMNNVREAFRSGEITEDNPNYETFSQMLIDWDKGVDYILEHYPEIFRQEQERGVAIGLDGALEQLQRFARFDLYNNDLTRFKDLDSEYRPENTYQENGRWGYDLGSIIDGNDVWMISMMYYVKDAAYYLIGYSIVVGSMGG